MIKLRVPATSANVGPGFDCLGLALPIYNEFEIEEANDTKLLNVEDRFNNEDNLFLQAFRNAGGKNIHATFHCNIPVSRGLGSSAALITAGIASAFLLKQNTISKEDFFQLASKMEGHPDNVAPCIFGGFTASQSDQNTYYMQQLPLDPSFQFTVLIPNVELSTEEARNILPAQYERKVAVSNTANAIHMVQALAHGDLKTFTRSAKDQYHEPYRSTLIPHYQVLKLICESDTEGTLLISGSGSTCLFVSQKQLSNNAKQQINNLPENWQIIETTLANHGIEVWENDAWHPITLS